MWRPQRFHACLKDQHAHFRLVCAGVTVQASHETSEICAEERLMKEVRGLVLRLDETLGVNVVSASVEAGAMYLCGGECPVEVRVRSNRRGQCSEQSRSVLGQVRLVTIFHASVDTIQAAERQQNLGSDHQCHQSSQLHNRHLLGHPSCAAFSAVPG